MFLKKKIYFKIFTIFLIIISFFIGFILRENAVGGGTEFYELSWPIIQSFKIDFLDTIKNYGKFRDYTLPFSHILNAYINPFSDNIEHFQLSITIISFVIFLIFFLALKKIFNNINFIDALLTSSIILLLPFFRTSAFWGKNENFGWLFLIIAFYFFYEIKKNISDNSDKKKIFNVILFCFSSACALYARQALIFLPISYFLYLYFNKADKIIFLSSIISFTVLAIPGFLLIWTWGDFYPALPDGNAPHGGFFGGWIQPIHTLKNFPILLSFFGFYLMPIVFLEFLQTNLKIFLNKYLKNFILAFLILLFLSQLNLLNYLGEYTMAGGAILKINYLIMKNNFLLLLVFSSIGFSILVVLFKENFKNNAVILLPLLIIYCFPKYLYQEYTEPLILIVFFLALKTNLHKTYFNNIAISHLIITSYFFIYLVGSIYFKHFMFSSYKDWIIFLGY